MRRTVQRLLACLSLASLAACASPPEIPFDHASNPSIKSIGVLQPAMSPGATVWLASDVGQSFGLIGALVDAGMQANRDKKFAALLAEQGVRPDDVFLSDIGTALTTHGYSVTRIPQSRSTMDLLKTYPSPGVYAADAYLDLAVVNYGYVAAGIGDSTPYRPFVAMRCRLVRASDAAVLMEDTVVYNPVGPAEKAVNIAPDPTFAFKDFDTLTGDPVNAARGLNAALASTATAVGTLVQ